MWTDKGLLPAGIDETEATVDSNCSSTANTVNAGYYCLLKVKNNGWKSQMMFGIRKFSYFTTLFKP